MSCRDVRLENLVAGETGVKLTGFTACMRPKGNSSRLLIDHTDYAAPEVMPKAEHIK